MAKTSLPLTHGSVTQPRAGAGSSLGISWESASASAPYLARARGWQLLAEQSSEQPQGHHGSRSRQTPLLGFREDDVKYRQQMLAVSRHVFKTTTLPLTTPTAPDSLCSSAPLYLPPGISSGASRTWCQLKPRIHAVPSKDTEPGRGVTPCPFLHEVFLVHPDKFSLSLHSQPHVTATTRTAPKPCHQHGATLVGTSQQAQPVLTAGPRQVRHTHSPEAEATRLRS